MNHPHQSQKYYIDVIYSSKLSSEQNLEHALNTVTQFEESHGDKKRGQDIVPNAAQQVNTPNHK